MVSMQQNPGPGRIWAGLWVSLPALKCLVPARLRLPLWLVGCFKPRGNFTCNFCGDQGHLEVGVVTRWRVGGGDGAPWDPSITQKAGTNTAAVLSCLLFLSSGQGLEHRDACRCLLKALGSVVFYYFSISQIKNSLSLSLRTEVNQLSPGLRVFTVFCNQADTTRSIYILLG